MSPIPLFLLSSVLFPKGVLRLRVFEKRYVDMVRSSMRTGQPFGVCLVTASTEKGRKGFERIGCQARVVDFDMEQLGVLEVRCEGEQRFEVLSHEEQADGLVVAQTELIAPDPQLGIPDEFITCASLAKELVKEIQQKLKEGADQVISQPYEFDSATWVGNRLCEVLPISTAARQELMALQDPISRLNLVDQYLKKQQIFS